MENEDSVMLCKPKENFKEEIISKSNAKHSPRDDH